MAISLVHAFTSAKSDGGDATLVKPSDWNAQHTLTVATDTLLGRATAGTGAVEEITCTSFARSILDDANEAAFKATVNLEIGVDVQAYDAELAAIAGLTSAADRVPYYTGSGTAALATFTTFGRSLVDDADAAAARTTLGAAASGPIVSASNNATQTISATTLTKVSFQTEVVDSAAAFASSAFTPQTAGYYWVHSQLYIDGTADDMQALIYKNGSGVVSGTYSTSIGGAVSGIVYCNGSTDYIEIYTYMAAGRDLAANACFFNSYFLRA